MFLFTIGDDYFIDELPTIVGINPEDRKRKERACTLDGCQNCLLTAIEGRKAFCPASRYICEG